ncbi:MAG: 4Fe-4S binding protein [Bacillota bacterium]|nr:4Fe-4S binding protein [Bacillota bacterium]
MKPEVIFNLNRCKGCGLCVSVCPRKILKLDTSVTNIKGYHPSVISDQSQCIACGSCARVCPDSVITVLKHEEDT